MAINLLDKAQLKKILGEINGIQNVKRKERDWISYQIFHGNLRPYVKAAIKETFPISAPIYRISNINLEKRIIDKLSQVYNEDPKREVNGEENENLENLYADGKFNLAFDNMDDCFNRSKHTLLWVQNDPLQNTEFRLIQLNPFVYDLIINNDTFEVEAVILSYPGVEITSRIAFSYTDSINQVIAESQSDSAATSKQYAIWTKDQHINVRASRDAAGNTTIDYMITEEEKNGEVAMGVNKLGMLPFEWITCQPDIPEYPVESSIADDTIEINILGANLLTASQLQIGQLILKYPEGNEVKQIQKGLAIYLSLPQSKEDDPRIETDAQYITPTSDLEGMKSVLLDYSGALIADYGLEGSGIVSGDKSFSSALERMIVQSSATKEINKNKKFYRNAEERVFEIVKKYDEVNGTKLFKIDDVLSIKYREIELLTQGEKLDIIERKADLEIIEDWEKITLDNPDMTPEDAKEKLKRIRESGKIMPPAPPLPPNNPADNPLDETIEEEQIEEELENKV